MLPSDSPHWPIFLASRYKAKLKDPSKGSILCLDRDQFCHDVAALRQFGQQFNYLSLDLALTNYLQADWMPQPLQHQFEDEDFRQPIYDEAWARASSLYVNIFTKLVKHVGLVAVLAANWDYWTDEGARRACEKMGIPFLVLLREQYALQSEVEMAPEYFGSKYTLKPRVDGVAVSDRVTAALLSDCKVIPPAKIRVTGRPRLDLWLESLSQPLEWSARNAIVLLTYTDGYFAGNHFEEMLAAFAAAAHKHGESTTQFVVKCKHLNDRKKVEEMLSQFPGHRLTLTHDTVFNALKTAKAVIGFNSASIVEALLAGVEIYVPQWGGTRIDPKYQLYSRDNPKHRRHVHFMHSAVECSEIIDSLVTNGAAQRDDRADRIDLVKDFHEFDPEFASTRRVEDFLREFINR